MACSDSPPCGRVRCVGQVHVSAQTRTGLGGPAATPAHSEEVPTADTPGSSRPWREEGSDSSRPPTSQKHCEPVKIRSLLSRTSQFLKSLRFNPHGRPQVAGQGWELTPALGGGDRQGAESRSADHIRDRRGSSHPRMRTRTRPCTAMRDLPAGSCRVLTAPPAALTLAEDFELQLHRPSSGGKNSDLVDACRARR